MPDHLEGKQSSETHSLTTLLCDLLKTEVLDESNRWECSSCNKKVCANRRHNFKSLPETVAIHLKRFRFDPVRDILESLFLIQPYFISLDD